MNLGINSTSAQAICERIEAAVDDAVRSGTFPATIHASAAIGGNSIVSVDCRLLAVESIACAFAQLDVVNEAWKTAPLAKLKQIAEQLAGRLNYLLEPIRTIETDVDTCTIQMRSLPPRKADDGTRTYYELQVGGGGKLSLCRYAKEPEQPRHTIPVQVTREVFGRLIADFVDVAGSARSLAA